MRLRKRCQAEFYNSLEYESIEKIVKANGFEYGNIDSLLKNIVNELYWDDDKNICFKA